MRSWIIAVIISAPSLALAQPGETHSTELTSDAADPAPQYYLQPGVTVGGLRTGIGAWNGTAKTFDNFSATVAARPDDLTARIDRADYAGGKAAGENFDVEITPKEFGRIAAQTAKQVIVQRIREAERDMVFDEFNDKVDTLTNGNVLRYEQRNMLIDLDKKAEAILPLSEQVPRESFRIGARVRVYVMEVRKTNRGPQIIVSRSHPQLVAELFKQEVPEVNQGLVQIKAVAREAGSRSKVAVSTWSPSTTISPSATRSGTGACTSGSARPSATSRT